jgi:hypothetical protein
MLHGSITATATSLPPSYLSFSINVKYAEQWGRSILSAEIQLLLQLLARNTIYKDTRPFGNDLDSIQFGILERSGRLDTRLKPDATDPILVGFFKNGLGDCWRGDD